MSLRKIKKGKTVLRVPASHRPATMISVARSRVPWESSEKRFSFATPSTFPKNEEFFGSRLTSPQDLFMLGFGKRKVGVRFGKKKSGKRPLVKEKLK